MAEDEGGGGIKLPFIHRTTSTVAAMITTSESDTDHPMHTIFDRFFRLRSSQVSLEKVLMLAGLNTDW